MNNSKNSKALTIANALVRQGVSSVGQPLRHFVPPPPLGKTRSEAMRRAWRTVKQRVIHTKTAGVTRGNRQTLLYRLTRYSADLISVTLRREPENTADKNAVQVIAAVKGKGSAVMGYLNRQLAEAIAPLLDKGKQVLAKFEAVTGGAEAFLNYGLNVGITV